MQVGSIIYFLNLRFIQSSHGISINQVQHVESILCENCGDTYGSNTISYVSEPFPTDMSFEHDIYSCFPIIDDEHPSYIQKYGGSLAHWVGKLVYLSTHTRLDL